MAPERITRDVGLSDEPARRRTGEGRKWIAVIGIDRYRTWGRLHNAVKDARGVLTAFERLGFEEAAALFDEAATGEAINHLAIDGLQSLGPEDSLVLFFAGHGHTDSRELANGKHLKQGYIIPFDAEADRPGRRVGSWVNLDSWLGFVVCHPLKHILIILDSCHSGIAIQVKRARGVNTQPFEQLRARTSRRVLTASLDSERAMDAGGPYDRHSLFTGCLLEALDGGLVARTGRRQVTALDLCSYVQSRVEELSNSSQTPVTGYLEPDDQGQLILEFPDPLPVPPELKPHGSADVSTNEHTEHISGGNTSKPDRDKGRKTGPKPKGPVVRPNGSLLDAAFVDALDRKDAARARGERVLSIILGDSTVVLADWAAWAAGRGYPRLITAGSSVDTAIRELLTQTPWLQCLAEARRCLAEAAGLEVEAVDATLDARSGVELRRWIDNVTGRDQRVQVSGWLISSLREGQGAIPNPATAPVQGGTLLSILCELATPIAVLVQHPAPSASWLEGAISTAATLLSQLPGRSIAVGAPRELVNRVLGSDRQSAALSMAREGMIPVAARRSRPPRVPGRRAKVLHEALARDPRTNGLFELNVQLPIPDEGPDVDVDLVARDARLAIVIEVPSHQADPQRDPRDRSEDARLERAGYSVRRFPAEDIDQRLALVVHEIAIGIGGRRLG